MAELWCIHSRLKDQTFAAARALYEVEYSCLLLKDKQVTKEEYNEENHVIEEHAS
jgi:hypothetical protein